MTIVTIPVPDEPLATEDERGNLLITQSWYRYLRLLTKAIGGSTTSTDNSLTTGFFNQHSLGVSQRVDELEALLAAALVRSSGVSFASTTEQLTGTAANKASTPDSVAALWEQGSNIASAATISIGEGGYFHVTGTTTITDIDFDADKAGRLAWLEFEGALTVTHSASTLILPGSANILTAAGDVLLVVSEGSDVVRGLVFMRKSATVPTATGIWAPLTTGVLSGGTDPEFVVTAAGEVIMAELV